MEDGFTQGRYISSLALLWKAVGHSDGCYTVTGRKTRVGGWVHPR